MAHVSAPAKMATGVSDPTPHHGELTA